MRASQRLNLVGIHAHIGSNIFELEPYTRTIEILADFIDFDCHLLNVGGGLGIAYTAEEEPASIEDYADVKVRGVQAAFDPVPRVLIEPGRSLVGNAGITVYRIGTIKEIPGVRTYVAVDGGMSDNLRPMLYDSRYDAAIADRPDAMGTQLATIAGMHCESGDILIKEVALPDPQVGRRARDSGDGRVRVRDGEQLQRRAAAAGDLLPGRRGARRGAARDLRGPGGARRMTAAPFRVGLLGHGTVGSAFDTLLAERAEAIAAATGRRPEIAGVLTRSRGSFDEILESSDAIVELIGGIEPAREYALRTLQAGKPLVTANKQLLSQHGDELFAAARAGSAQLRYEAAVAGVVPVIRVMRESFAGAHIEKVHGIVNGTTNFILSEMARTGASYADVLKRAQDLGYAEADPTEDVNGKDAAAKMAILARLAFHAEVTLDNVPFEGIEQITSDDLDYAKEFGLVLKLLGVAERRDGGVSVRVFPAFLYGGHPLASVVGPFNAVTLESEAITEVTLSGPGAGGPQTASAVLGDVVSVMSSAGMELDPIEQPRFLPEEEVESAFYLYLEVEDRPGVLAQVAQVLGDHEVSVKSVVQKGIGENARLVMVMHRVAGGQVPQRARRHLQARVPALAAALDPGDRGGVRVVTICGAGPRPADRALPRPAAGRRRHAGRLADGGLDSADPRAAPVRAHRHRDAPQVRGHEPDRQLQGPRHDARGVVGEGQGGGGDHLRLDRATRPRAPPPTPRAPACAAR